MENKKSEEEKPQLTKNIEEGFESNPDGPSKEMIIKPATSKETQIPGANNKEGKKRIHRRKRIYKNKKNEPDEQDSNGSANAFEGK
jgi:hypothetical protein